MSGVSMFQLLPVVDQIKPVSTTMNSQQQQHAEGSADQKLKTLVEYFEKQNSHQREHTDLLAFLNTKKVPDDVLHLLYNEVIIKKNKHTFIDQPTAEKTNEEEDAVVSDETPAGIAVAAATTSANTGVSSQKKSSDEIIAEERKANIILRNVPKSYHSKANIVYDVIKNYFDSAEELGRCLDYLVTTKTIINPLYISSLAKVMKMDSVKRVIAPRRYRFLENLIESNKNDDNEVDLADGSNNTNSSCRRMGLDKVFDDNSDWVL
jgi:hypothetical protein